MTDITPTPDELDREAVERIKDALQVLNTTIVAAAIRGISTDVEKLGFDRVENGGQANVYALSCKKVLA
jgi:hypothetical protein